MKKLILSVMVAVFGVAVMAGDSACSEGGGCCSKSATEAKAQCPMTKQQANAGSKSKAKSGNKVVSNKQVLLSPKAQS